MINSWDLTNVNKHLLGHWSYRRALKLTKVQRVRFYRFLRDSCCTGCYFQQQAKQLPNCRTSTLAYALLLYRDGYIDVRCWHGISAMCVQIFALNFTQLLIKCTLQLSFVEIYLKVTKLCRFNQDNSHFSVFERRAELAASELCRVHWEHEWPPYLQIWIRRPVTSGHRAGTAPLKVNPCTQNLEQHPLTSVFPMPSPPSVSYTHLTLPTKRIV